MKTIAVVYGTRPEAIKLAPLILELRNIENIQTVIICSGQHKEMLLGILELWSLAPDLTLKPNFQSIHSSAIPELMRLLEKELLRIKPDLVIVQGDTATATASALQAHALHIPVGHVEAGLRSDDLWNPWPEESNRKIIDAIASLHFAPTKISAENLAREGYELSTALTGNTIVDALIHATKKLDENPQIRESLEKLLGFSLTQKYILFTQHRREGFGEGQSRIFKAISDLANLGYKIIFPVHLNPNVQGKAKDALGHQKGIYLIPPQEYLSFLELTRFCSLIISDSGGLQEEAQYFGKRILITRLTTERPEIINNGLGTLVGFDGEEIIRLTNNHFNLRNDYKIGLNPFGNGNTAKLIQNSISEFLGKS